jgi:hypothetical protein
MDGRLVVRVGDPKPRASLERSPLDVITVVCCLLTCPRYPFDERRLGEERDGDVGGLARRRMPTGG